MEGRPDLKFPPVRGPAQGMLIRMSNKGLPSIRWLIPILAAPITDKWRGQWRNLERVLLHCRVGRGSPFEEGVLVKEVLDFRFDVHSELATGICDVHAKERVGRLPLMRVPLELF